jgi:hypothetical protein
MSPDPYFLFLTPIFYFFAALPKCCAIFFATHALKLRFPFCTLLPPCAVATLSANKSAPNTRSKMKQPSWRLWIALCVLSISWLLAIAVTVSDFQFWKVYQEIFPQYRRLAPEIIWSGMFLQCAVTLLTFFTAFRARHLVLAGLSVLLLAYWLGASSALMRSMYDIGSQEVGPPLPPKASHPR